MSKNQQENRKRERDKPTESSEKKPRTELSTGSQPLTLPEQEAPLTTTHSFFAGKSPVDTKQPPVRIVDTGILSMAKECIKQGYISVFDFADFKKLIKSNNKPLSTSEREFVEKMEIIIQEAMNAQQAQIDQNITSSDYLKYRALTQKKLTHEEAIQYQRQGIENIIIPEPLTRKEGGELEEIRQKIDMADSKSDMLSQQSDPDDASIKPAVSNFPG